MKNTLFIVGAGASTDFNMPLGTALVRRISDRVGAEIGAQDRPLIESAMRKLDYSLLQSERIDFGDAARDLAGAAASAFSIDRLLETRVDRPLVIALGKRAIAAEIALGESGSPLSNLQAANWSERQFAKISVDETWIGRLFALISARKRPDDARNMFERLKFITFNYDRFIEAYLSLAIELVMDQTESTAQQIVRELGIIHVYGSLGALPGIGENAVRLGASVLESGAELDIAASGIRTFTEAHDQRILKDMWRAIEWSELVVFLGFGFDNLNVRAPFPKPLRIDQKYIGTQLNVGPRDQASANGLIASRGAFGTFFSSQCSDFVRSYELMEAIGF